MKTSDSYSNMNGKSTIFACRGNPSQVTWFGTLYWISYSINDYIILEFFFNLKELILSIKEVLDLSDLECLSYRILPLQLQSGMLRRDRSY